MLKMKKKYWWWGSLMLLLSCTTIEQQPDGRATPAATFPKGPKFIVKEKLEKPETVSVVRSHGKYDPEKNKKEGKKSPKKFHIELECVSSLREFKAGKPVKMTFRMRNYEFKTVFIKGWMVKEINNISLYYIPWQEKMKKPPENQWFSIKPELKAKPESMTLELSPRNSVLLDVELPFIKDLKPSEPKHFVIYAQIKVDYIIKNQIKVDTFLLQSKYIKIIVKP